MRVAAFTTPSAWGVSWFVVTLTAVGCAGKSSPAQTVHPDSGAPSGVSDAAAAVDLGGADAPTSVIEAGLDTGASAERPTTSTDGGACPTAPFDDSDQGVVDRCTVPIAVAVGNGLRRALSLDGQTWDHDVYTPNDGADQNEYSHRDVVIAKGLIVIVGDGGVFVSFDAGETFTVTHTGRFHDAGLTYFQGAIWVVSDFGTLSTVDGTTWKEWLGTATLPGNVPGTFGANAGVVVGDGKLFAVSGRDGHRRFFDGTTWTEQTFDSSYGSLSASAYGGGRFLVLGSACCDTAMYAGLRATSPDGVTWTLLTNASPGSGDYRFGDVLWTGTQFFATGTQYGKETYVSSDGLTWDRAPNQRGRGAHGHVPGRLPGVAGRHALPLDGRHQLDHDPPGHWRQQLGLRAHSDRPRPAPLTIRHALDGHNVRRVGFRLSPVDGRARTTPRGAPRVLLIAEAANPDWVSVPLVGWSLARALTDLCAAHVVTHVRNRDAIARAGWTEGQDFTAIDSEAVARPMWLSRRASCGAARASAVDDEHGSSRRSRTTTSRAPRVATVRRRHFARREYDIVHRITPLSPTIPSLVAHRCRRAGVPFVWGPVNGGIAWPPGFQDVIRAEGEWLSYLRAAHRLLPAYRATRRDASAIMVASGATMKELALYEDKCVYVPENAIDPARFDGALPRGPARGPLRVAFVGRLVPYKGADMLIEAAAPLVRDGSVTLEIIGDGPQRGALDALVRERELGAGVVFTGWIPNDKLGERLARAEVFGFPSVREFGGGVVLEAMALGLVPLVVDYGGPGELVTDRTGFRVPIGPRAALIAGFRETLGHLVTARDSIAEMGARARARVQTLFTWRAKAHQVLDVYEWVLGRAPKPSLGMPFPDVATDVPRGGGRAEEGLAPS